MAKESYKRDHRSYGKNCPCACTDLERMGLSLFRGWSSWMHGIKIMIHDYDYVMMAIFIGYLHIPCLLPLLIGVIGGFIETVKV